jgi:diguanylate cyclase (GGDEF)-like protein
MNDMRERAHGVRDYIIEAITGEDFQNISDETEAGVIARKLAQDRLDLLLDVGKLRHLYIASKNEAEQIITTLNITDPDGKIFMYVPTGELEVDLLRSFEEGVAVLGRRIYQTEYGRVYTIYWPLSLSSREESSKPIAVVCMEFDADHTYDSLQTIRIYSLALSGAMILVLSLVSYLSLSNVGESFYRKLAYLDYLTGVHNRLSYEQRLSSCKILIEQGRSISLLMLDINDLKKINDTLGHKAGDDYIINTANAIKDMLGTLGELYRIGGDEFAVIIVDRDQKEIDKVLDLLRQDKRPVLGKLTFSCASGAATFTPGLDRNLHDLAHRADEEMYGEKRRQKERLKGGRRKE